MATRRFIGRDRELDKLDSFLRRVKRTGEGAFLSVRGRRQVGKSRLFEEFLGRSGAKSVFYTASQQSADEELEAFRVAVAESNTRAADLAKAGSLGSWEAAFALLASEATKASPVIIIIDEFPYLAESLPAIEAILQKVWDRTLEGQPVFLVLLGSDISMMEKLNTYGRPLYNRAEEMLLAPMSPKEIGEMLSLGAVETLESYLVLGGFPRLATRWERDDTLWKFLKRELQDPESSLVVLGERMLNAEFPSDLRAREIIRAIGSGERTHKGILTKSGVPQKALDEALKTLVEDKRVVVKASPYSAERRTKVPNYYVADPYLRFWLRFIESAIPTLERGRSDLVLASIKNSWLDYQGKAIEPVVQRGVECLLPDPRFGEAHFVGSFWTRDSQQEVDLVGGRERDEAGIVEFVGSIKWRDNKPFSRKDVAALHDHRGVVPGATSDTRLIAVSRTGFDAAGLDVELTAEDIIAAYA
ncbi:MAG TPA: ATP-binding protein [Gaiellaceae bacterium]|nr:ATP-binding protein [Gaiellaceae bacterium]